MHRAHRQRRPALGPAQRRSRRSDRRFHASLRRAGARHDRSLRPLFWRGRGRSVLHGPLSRRAAERREQVGQRRREVTAADARAHGLRPEAIVICAALWAFVSNGITTTTHLALLPPPPP